MTTRISTAPDLVDKGVSKIYTKGMAKKRFTTDGGYAFLRGRRKASKKRPVGVSISERLAKLKGLRSSIASRVKRGVKRVGRRALEFGGPLKDKRYEAEQERMRKGRVKRRARKYFKTR